MLFLPSKDGVVFITAYKQSVDLLSFNTTLPPN
jgi:hypothetical protein